MRGQKMNITEVRIWLLNNPDSKLKAIASVTIGNALVVHDIKIIDGSEGLFIAMPSRKTGENDYRDIVHPINAESRAILIEAVLNAYNEERAKAE